MDAQTLGALADIVKEAIAEAVAPLHDRIKELEGRREYDPQPLAEFSTQATQSLGQVGERLKALEGRAIPTAYDDSGVIERLKALESVTPPAAYDDSALESRVKKLEANLGGDIAPSVSKQLAQIPGAYDDTALRAELSDLIKQQDQQIELAMKMAAERPEPSIPRDGTDGRDALQLEVLPAIDESKNYPRGTYAKHAGGLWRSFEQTHGMRGWECIVDGIAGVTPRLNGKSLELIIRQSSGAQDVLQADLPIQEYKGVFNGGDYVAHDTATWAGSLWHCNKSGTQAKPGDGSPDWTLAVKKGRDGREVVKTERVQGPVQI